MGLSTPVSQCLVTPPYLAAAGVTWIEAYYADQWRVRSPFILGNCVAVGVGMLLFLSPFLCGFLDPMKKKEMLMLYENLY